MKTFFLSQILPKDRHQTVVFGSLSAQVVDTLILHLMFSEFLRHPRRTMLSETLYGNWYAHLR